jgi:hypothetical protein
VRERAGARAAEIFPFVIAVVLPPAGLVIGAFQLTQEDRELGWRLVIAAALAAVAWAVLLIR